MKKQFILTTLFVSFLFVAFAQDANQISTMRLGPFRLGSKIPEVESVIKSKIRIKKSIDEWADTIMASYNGADYRLVFTSNTDENNQRYWQLNSVSSANTLLKTKSGLGIGNTKAQILLAYDKFNITIYNDWNYEEKKNTKDRVQFIQLRDNDSGTEIIFTTVDRNITEIEVTYQEEGC